MINVDGLINTKADKDFPAEGQQSLVTEVKKY